MHIAKNSSSILLISIYGGELLRVSDVFVNAYDAILNRNLI